MLDTFRKISWVKTDVKEFKRFPKAAREEIEGALTLVPQGEKAEIAKPMKGMGTGGFKLPWNTALMLSGRFMPLKSMKKYGSCMPLRKNPKRELKPRSRILILSKAGSRF